VDFFTNVYHNAATAACAELGTEDCAVLTVDSTALGGDVSHVRVHIQVGPTDYDRIVVHRVIARDRTRILADTPRAVMLLPSDIVGFEPVFLPPSCTDQNSEFMCLAAYLAGERIDVWGLDDRTTSVPEEIDDLDFMADWGLETSLDDTALALLAARLVRGITVIQPDLGLHLLGFEESVPLAVAVADSETQLSAASRSVSGLVLVDGAVKYGEDDEATRQFSCAREDSFNSQLASGDYAASNDAAYLAGELAQTDPDGQSPYNPRATNYEYALLAGAATYGGFAPVPHFHFTAGVLDDDDLPTNLIYTDEDRWIDLMASAYPYDSAPFYRDTHATACDETDVPWDDHLEEVTVPVISIGAAGGYGDLGIYTTTLLGSDDVTNLVIQHQSADNAVEDFGAYDIWLSDTGKTQVWEPLADWIKAH
jgi:hypothetical protein